MVKKHTPIQPRGGIGAPLPCNFKKNEILGVFRPFIQRSLTNVVISDVPPPLHVLLIHKIRYLIVVKTEIRIQKSLGTDN